MQATGVTAQQYMENWLLQINYPQVDIILKSSQTGNSQVEFRQNRFLLTVLEENVFAPIVSPFGLVLK
jgi:hypothetical protein